MSHYTDHKQPLILPQLGNLVGCILAALFGDKLGRRRTLWTGTGISAIGAVLQAAAHSFPMLMLGRVVNGIGNGESHASI